MITVSNENKTEREQIFETLNTLTETTGIKWEINFDDFEILSVNFIYEDDEDDDDK